MKSSILYPGILTGLLLIYSPMLNAQPDLSGASLFYQQHLGDLLQTEPYASFATNPRYPKSSYTPAEGGAWKDAGPGDWGSGFYPGIFWLVSDWWSDSGMAATARQWTLPLEFKKNDIWDHDLGFILGSSFGLGWKYTGQTSDLQVMQTAVESFQNHWMPDVGSYWSFNFNQGYRYDGLRGGFRARQNVIIDTTMNLEMVLQMARATGNTLWVDRVMSHYHNVERDLIRDDGSTVQIATYYLEDTTDPDTGIFYPAGSFKAHHGWQGYGPHTTWSRGQGWAIHGLTSGLRETGDPLLLPKLEKLITFATENDPGDGVPYWDYIAPDLSESEILFRFPNVPVPVDGLKKDSSAAAIMAAGLFEYARLVPDEQLSLQAFEFAEKMLGTLLSDAYRGDALGMQPLLGQGTYSYSGTDLGQAWGDFYLTQAIERYRLLTQPSPTFENWKTGNSLYEWIPAMPRHWKIDHEAGRQVLVQLPTVKGQALPARWLLSQFPFSSAVNFDFLWKPYANLATDPEAVLKIIVDFQDWEDFHVLEINASGLLEWKQVTALGTSVLQSAILANPFEQAFTRWEINGQGGSLSILREGVPVFTAPYTSNGGRIGFATGTNGGFWDDFNFRSVMDYGTGSTPWYEFSTRNGQLPILAFSTSPNADSDQDGRPALLEFLQRSNPDRADAPASDFVRLHKGSSGTECTLRVPADTFPLDWGLEVSSDLESGIWLPVDLNPGNLHGSYREWTATLPGNALFFRVRAALSGL